MSRPQLDDDNLVAAVRAGLTEVVRYRLDPDFGNNLSVVVDQTLPTALTESEIGERDPKTLQALLDRVVGTRIEARGYSFTVTSIKRGDRASATVLATLKQAPSAHITR